MRKCGLVLKATLVADGKFRNVDAVGDAPRSKKGWYWIPPHARYAAFGHHRPEINKRWRCDSQSEPTTAEINAWQEELREARRLHEKEQAKLHRQCREASEKIWDAARTPDPDHAYLKAKGIQGLGVRQFKGDLIVAVRDSKGKLNGLQFIKPRGVPNKFYKKGTCKKGNWSEIGGPITDRVIIVEGFATGATVFEATAIPVICAFDAGNLEFVADEVRRKYPVANIVIGADNDADTFKNTGENPGLDAGRAAAIAICAHLAYPTFDNQTKDESDFNDLATASGLDAVRYAFEKAEFLGEWPPPINIPQADPHTDVANVQRLAKAFGGRLLYARGRGWYHFGPPWQRDMQAAERFAAGLGQLVRREADQAQAETLACSDEDERARLQKAEADLRAWAKTSESAGRISAAVRIAASHLAIPGGFLDTRLSLVSFPNGVLDLNTRAFRAHVPSDLLSLSCGCPYELSAKAPRWRKFIREAFSDDRDLMDFVQCALGYAFLGRQHEHLILLLHGDGENGKGTLIRAILNVFGDYAVTAPANLLLTARGDRHPTELVLLAGKRIVIHGETAQDAVLDAAKLKNLTGDDEISARGMRKDFVSFKPSHLLILHTNHLLRVKDTTHGFWRRVRVVPFKAKFRGSKRERGIDDLLKAEASGIINWLLAGLWRYKKHGLRAPASVRNATKIYRQDEEVRHFIRDKCFENDAANIQFGALYAAYRTWARAQGRSELLTSRKFGIQLTERGIKKGKSNGVRIRRGLDLK